MTSAVELTPAANIGRATRIACGIALVCLLYLVVTASLAGSLRSRAPELALRLAPWDAQAAGQLAQALLLSDPSSRTRAMELAETALRRDATVVPAVVALGTAADFAGKEDIADGYFAYSEKLSRRNMLTQIWWIEQAIEQDDIPGALRHYDIALRAIRQSRDILFPVLGRAIAEADVRRHLVPVLRRNPSWGRPFFEWLVVNGIESPSAATLIQALEDTDFRIEAGLAGRLQERLIEQRNPAAAWALYRARQTGARLDQSRDGDFRSAWSGTVSPFDWNIVAGQGAATISQVEGRPVIAFSTLPAEGGVMARQFQLLPPGRYYLRDVSMVTGDADAAPVYWALRCADGREVGRVTLGSPDRTPERILVVPPACPAQWLVLASDAGDSIQGRDGTVYSATLGPAEAGL